MNGDDKILNMDRATRRRTERAAASVGEQGPAPEPGEAPEGESQADQPERPTHTLRQVIVTSPELNAVLAQVARQVPQLASALERATGAHPIREGGGASFAGLLVNVIEPIEPPSKITAAPASALGNLPPVGGNGKG